MNDEQSAIIKGHLYTFLKALLQVIKLVQKDTNNSENCDEHNKIALPKKF